MLQKFAIIFLIAFTSIQIGVAQGFIDKSFVGCGLNFNVQTLRLSERASNSSPKFPMDTMPAKMHIDVLGGNKKVVQAYLLASVSGNNVDFTPTIVDPKSELHAINYIEIETGDDPCWSYASKNLLTYDVTEIIRLNGDYYFDGFPLSSSLSGTDTDGLMLLVIYSDPFDSFIGNLYLSKGVLVSDHSVASYTIKNIDVDETSTTAKGFMLAADLQDNGSKISINNSSLYGINKEEFWDYETKNTAVFANQTTSSFKMNTPNDCAHLLAVGLYFQQSYASQEPTLAQLGDTLIAPSAENYEWYLENNLISTADSFYVATYPGTYSAIIEDIAGCKYSSDSIEIVCFENYKPKIYQDGRWLETDTFYVSYQWYKDNLMITEEMNDSIYAGDSASYYVEVIDSLGCTYQSKEVVYSSVNSISENSLNKNLFEIYPNPTTAGGVNFVFKENMSLYQISIYTLDGRLVYSKQINNTFNKLQIELESGVYLINLSTSEHKNSTSRLVVY